MTIAEFVRKTSVAAPVFAVVFVAAGTVTPSSTQAPQPAARQGQATQKSVGRGWPVPVPLNRFDGFPEDYFVGAVTPWYYVTNAAATGGKAPAGV
mgnify:CR=1 FL=1